MILSNPPTKVCAYSIRHFHEWLLLKHAPALPWTSWICITLAKMMCIQMCCIFLIFQGLGTVPHSWKSLQKRVTGGYCCICMRWYFRHITSFITLPSPCGAFLFSSLFPRAIKIHIYSRLDFWPWRKKLKGKITQNSRKKLKTQENNSKFRHFLGEFLA